MSEEISMERTPWTLEEFKALRPDLDDVIAPVVLLVYNLAIEKHGRTREEVVRLVAERTEEARDGQVVPLPVLYGTLLEDVIPVVVRDASNPLGVRWFFGDTAEDLRRHIEQDRQERARAAS
jgi:hypothetical protein